MSNLFYGLHSLIRRNLFMLERILVATGLAFVVYSLTQSKRVYPMYWDVVIISAVFLLTLWSPVAGYFLAVLAACYPLYTISIYLAVLFLAITIIGQHLFIQNLSATLLTLASPLLGGIYLAWVIPLLGGLWWGPAGGAAMGAIAALWGQLFAGMAGLSPDWLSLLGTLPDLRSVSASFSSADSFETLRLFFAPFFSNSTPQGPGHASTSLLYAVLQIAIWAFVGWLVGMLAGKEWFQYHKPRATIVLVAVGAPVLALLHILPAIWLLVPIRPQAWESLGYASLYSALAAAILEAGAYFFEHPIPLPRPRARQTRESRQPVPVQAPLPPADMRSSPGSSTGRSSPGSSTGRSSPGSGTGQPMDKDNKPDDLIMLELD